MSKLIELAARSEAATGPDRELDGLIEVARDPMHEVILYNEPGPFPQKAVRGPVKDLELTGRDLADYIRAPTYTASLDAAMTLVPEGWNFKVETVRHLSRGRIGLAIVWDGMHGPSDLGDAATPALALCAAALRARASLDTDVGEGKG